MNRTRILVVDDEHAVMQSLVVWLKKSGYMVNGAASGPEALKLFEASPFDLVFLDMKMPEMDGLDVLRAVKESYPKTLVVMMTAYGSIETAVEAMKNGASDYLMKPLDPDLLEPLIVRLLQLRELVEENMMLRERLFEVTRFENFIGGSEAIKPVFRLISDVADTNSSVLITGETGTGKEVVAKTIHAISARKDAPFIAVNCGAFPEHLLESELFGHERGAFTGASQARRGRLELCRGGTLFLDEIGDISWRMQVDLLRVLEEKQFYRLGGETPINVDFRLITATNRDLSKAVAAGEFRADLFYRLNVIAIHVPPLRERTGDVSLLADYFLKRFNSEMKKNIKSLSRQAVEFLNSYSWPGNVRELQNAIERAVVLCKGHQIGVEELEFLHADGRIPQTDLALEQVIREHIERVMNAHNGNISRCAEILGMHRSTLHKKLKEYRLVSGVPDPAQ